ncbi:transcription initiation factor TFIID component TAF4 family-domain-containing protein [Radiomyces spectabilis]|uniref:transcription initiation factor TFIID component TAF4 family-domain-containing protein n=1 Tax=Radiomyces spectabilis TaxID=64574 RepID=UPI002220968C|nr:transcription initiation factor TFIID component TAF4 family-domain-containing protein [Radiomyces spectabilis]KAI8384521.1 transcription initiation factor TFIID component TAF4 family-domain-containing protein [Radiomyces spectabilis]
MSKDNSNGSNRLQNLNFSLPDMLNDHGSLNNNNANFQSIMQSLNSGDTSSPSMAHLPVELQQLFSSKATDDLLASGASHNTNPMNQPNITDMASMWHAKTNDKRSDPLHTMPSNLPNPVPYIPHLQNASLQQRPHPSSLSHPAASPVMSMNHANMTDHNSMPAPSTGGATTLLEKLQSQLPPERKEKFIQLFWELTSNSLTPDQFLTQANMLLGPEQYQQLLLELKNKPSANPSAASSSAATAPSTLQQSPSSRPDSLGDRKRTISSSQLRAEDTQRAMSGFISPQLKRAKTEHIPMSMPLSTPTGGNGAPMFQTPGMPTTPSVPTTPAVPNTPSMPTTPAVPATPAVPNVSTATPNISNAASVSGTPAVPGTPATPGAQGTAGTPALQIPRTIAPTTPTTKPPTTSASSTSAPSGGPSSDRIDYETLTDVMGYAGVDLKEEVEHFLKDGDAIGGVLPDGIDRSKMQDFMNTDMLRDIVLRHAKTVAISKVDSDFISYLALATQDRIRTLIEQMITASRHRVRTQSFKPPPTDDNDQPVYKIVVEKDVKRQLLAVERAEREKELKRRSSSDTTSVSDKNDDSAKDSKSRRLALKEANEKDELQARNKNTNDTALMSAGGVRKSWMLTGIMKRSQQSLSATIATNGDGENQPESLDLPSVSKRERGRYLAFTKNLPQDQLSSASLSASSIRLLHGRSDDPGVVTVRDAIFAMEQDAQAGRKTGQRALLKSYSHWLK